MSVSNLIKKYQIHPKKRLGQNFLVNPQTLEKIVSSCLLTPNDVVIEIGSGLGVMTSNIAEQCRTVFAIEKDEELLRIAEQEFHHLQNISWIHDDILNVDLQKIVKTCDEPLLHIIGNIPYEITSPLLFHLLDSRHSVKRATLLMQKEVALRLIASPKTKDYGILSVVFQAFAHVQKLFDVSAAQFFPKPKVTSTLVQIDFQPSRSLMIDDEKLFRHLVRSAFGKRRKTLRNSLKGVFATNLFEEACHRISLDPQKRPEEVKVEEYISLANHFQVR